ncbi:sugar kinase [Paenibacillus sp. H1-7]|uniref:bifunctional heptose 7-phosphate kinase/heptose 1-phosphate adenyltransferase n=1 Tax=Paenibacillus sp. H1-7 TaxID=2282849 RepID=UPI001EF8E1A5|nr:PfkB family carbohydrate kinase [Paenibacillus sp. H1-7]ULL16894.1 sugar kinase [Paenibacillus sp. H1-7]
MVHNDENRNGQYSVPVYEGLSRERVADLLQRISKLRVGVIGDGCLDMYLHADMTLSELSRETPHFNLPVVRERFSPGAAGNVAVNLKALGCSEVLFCSVIGRDWRGQLLTGSLQSNGIDTSLVWEERSWTTPAYCKTIRHGLQNSQQEDPRIDYTNYAPLGDIAVERLLENLDRMAARIDVIGVTDQLRFGVIGPMIRARLQYWAKQGKLVVADSRDHIGLYDGILVKPNEVEALQWHSRSREERVPERLRHQRSVGNKAEYVIDSDVLEAGKALAQSIQAPCCLTMGEQGALWLDTGSCMYVPTEKVPPPIDFVGAGDCFSASLMSALGAGAIGPEAAAFAHLGAAVAVSKIGETGSASPEEIKDRYDRKRV